MVLTVGIMTSCSNGGLNAKKCEEIAQKNVESITNSDLEFVVDQLDMVMDKMSDPEEAKKLEDDNSDESKVFFSAMNVLLQYSIEKGELPSDVQKKFDDARSKAGKIAEKAQMGMSADDVEFNF